MRRVHTVLKVIMVCWGCVLADESVGVLADESVRVSVRYALLQLIDQGYPIIFSDDLVSAEVNLPIETLTLETVEAALPEVGLTLKKHRGKFLVVPAEPAPSPTVPDQLAQPAPQPAVETLIVTGTRHHLPRTSAGSLATMSGQEMDLVPSLGGDAIRVTNRLPGMSWVGVSARPRVRGGLKDELLIMVDGVELLNPFHLADFQSIFSAVDDRTVDEVDVYTGGFPARYGNRMSGVMDISTLSQADKPGTELGLSVFSALANTRGTSADGRTEWLASARHGNLDLLTTRLNARTGDPRYYDAFGRLGRRLNDHTKLIFGGFWSRDDVQLADDAERARSNIDSTYVWTRLDLDLPGTVRNTTLLSYVSSDHKKRQESPGDEDVNGFLTSDQNTRKIVLRSGFSQTLGPHLMEYGAHLEHASSRYDTKALIDRTVLGEILGRERVDAFDIQRKPEGEAGGLYWSGEFVLWDVLTIQPGLRWDFQDYFQSGLTDDVSPRLGLRYSPSRRFALRVDAGRFHQPEAIHEMQVTDGVDHFFATQHADHWIAAVEWEPTAARRLRAEVYRKKYTNPKLRFENLFNPFVLLPELEADRVPIAPSKAEAEGFDLELRQDFGPSLTGTLRYSYMDADDLINGVWVPRRWSQRHTVNAITTLSTDSFTLSAALTWHSGWRTSTPPPSIAVGEQVPVETILNNTELDDYISLDLSASRSWQVGRTRITAYADITNVFDRNNQAGIDYDIEQIGERYHFFPDEETLLPIIPSVGLLIAF